MNLIPLLLMTLACPAVPVQDAAPKPSAEAVRARDAVADIALLESIVPLKLRPSQIDALLVPMKSAHSAYLQLVAKDDEGLKTLEPFLTKLRDNAFRGKLPSRDDVKRWTDEDAASAKRGAEARAKAIDEIVAVLDKVLDDTQKEEVLRQSDAFFGARRVPKEFSKNPTKAPREKVIGLALSTYSQRVLVMERAIALLGKIKTPTTTP
ncbi:MAG: hypothetical protein ACOVT5_01110 [Armatimonadaceae bacterium]|jgi:hypothetical protein